MKADDKELIEQGIISVEEFFVAEYFGIKDTNMEGMMKAYHQFKLQALKEEAQSKIEILERQGSHADIYDYDKDCINAIIAYLKGILSFITNLED